MVEAFLTQIYDAGDPSYPPIGTVVTISSPLQGDPIATLDTSLAAQDLEMARSQLRGTQIDERRGWLYRWPDEREIEILRLTAEGLSNGQMAKSLWVTEQTVKFHLSNIYRKIEVRNRTEASRWAQQNGVLERTG